MRPPVCKLLGVTYIVQVPVLRSQAVRKLHRALVADRHVAVKGDPGFRLADVIDD